MNINPSKIADYLRPIPKKNLVLSILIGGALGAFTAVITNACLLEITLNGFFTIYFAAIFFIVGIFMAYTSYKKINQSQNPNSPDQTFMKEEKNYFFLIIAGILLASGFFVLFLDESWTRNLSYILKVN
jgi:ABC-type branched-subunit amino acid transport system permease subunit